MTVTTTVEQVAKAAAKLMARAELSAEVEMKIEDNSIIYKLPDDNGQMVIAAFQHLTKNNNNNVNPINLIA